MDRLDRNNRIIEILKNRESIKVKDLCSIFNVSEVTMRKDLSYLSSKGLIIKSHGGARLYRNLLVEPFYNDKKSQHLLEKDQIAKKASEYINDGDVLFFSTGTTITKLCKYIINKNNLTVITNDLNTAYELSGKENIKLIVTGGICRENSYSLIGNMVMNLISSFGATKAFIGCSGFNSIRGITTPLVEEGSIAKLMIENSNQIFILADSSKYGKEALFQTARLKEVDFIITDSGFPESEIKKISAEEVNIIIA